MVPEIWSETDRIICHFGLFLILLSHYQPAKSKFLKNKKTTEDVIISHMCTKNYDHMMYGSWDMMCDTSTDK